MAHTYNSPLLGFSIDKYGRRVFGARGSAGVGYDASPRSVSCVCGENFVTFYPTQAYCGDLCQARGYRIRKRLNRKIVMPTDAPPPPPKAIDAAAELPAGDMEAAIEEALTAAPAGEGAQAPVRTISDPLEVARLETLWRQRNAEVTRAEPVTNRDGGSTE